MVFEAVVVELLNKFLNQYIENLDTSQLKIGIWGGDVVLKNMKIKSTIFDDLNLPVRVKWGKLGKLFLKIPWKNLYSAPAIIEIHDLLLIIVPNAELKYDPVKEEKWAQEKKQTKLRAVEEAKKRELEVAEAQKDSFLEKLVTQIIKNIQFVIRNIHIRYEDKTTVPESPFSVGITMSNLSSKTTDDDPTSISLLKDNDRNFICKVINLDGLSIYWNSGSVLFSDLPDDKLIDVMTKSIPTIDFKPEGFMYMFGPLSASCFLRLNPKPELDGSNFTIPKVFINVHLKEIELAITSNQFCDAMAYIQDFNRFLAATKYRKYRPVGIPVIGHAKEWWKFACRAVLEDIIRRKTEWSWSNIKQHRLDCKKYTKLFRLKLVSKKMLAEDLKELEELEKKLNVFNLILLREQVYVEVERGVQESSSKGGWFSGWFGYGNQSKSDSSEDEIVKKLQSVMTSQEKQKLYKAIGYEESDLPTNYPVEFVELQFWFHLDEIKATVYHDHFNQLVPILISSVKSVKIELQKRPSGNAMKFVLIIGNFEVIGKQEIDESYPELVNSNCWESQSLIELVYETHPLDASCDQRVIFNALPLRIIYHVGTINLLQEVFRTPASDEMDRIVAATSASLPTFQRITSLGLQYAIEKRTELEVKVNVMSSYLIIPYDGVYHPEKDMLVLMFGKLNVETEENKEKNISVRQMSLGGTTAEEIFSKVLSASYTKFKCQLTGVQILFQLRGEDWVSASNMQRSSLQFLEPTNLQVTIKKSLVMDDARIPKMIIEGKMPSIAFNFSEERFLSFVALASSIQMKTEKSSKVSKRPVTSSTWSIQSFSTQLENTLKHMQKETSVTVSSDYVQGIDLVARFEISEFSANVTKTKKKSDNQKESEAKVSPAEKKFLNLSIIKLQMEFTKKTFEVIYLFKLGGIDFRQHHNKNWLDFLSGRNQKHDYLFVAEIVTLDTKIPDFYTKKGAVVNRLTLKITPLRVSIEKAAVLAQLEFVQNVQRRVQLVMENFNTGHLADAGNLEKETIYEELTESKKVISKGKRFRRKTNRMEVIDYFLEANLDGLDIVFEFEGKGLAEFKLKGGGVKMSSRKSYSTVDLNIEEVLLYDLNLQTKHPKIVTSLEDRTLSSRVTVYDKEYFGAENSLDMSVEAAVGGIQCTFVGLFFSRVLEFLNDFHLQVEMLKQGATIAAQKAKENVVKAFRNAAEICLKIEITAPLLLMPRTSVSMEALLVDLGVLTIKNSITELDYTPDGGEQLEKRPVIDVLKVHLQNLKMGRCVLSRDSEVIKKEKVFLVPITFDLNIKRNLSKEWFRVIPELEIVARLAAVRVTLTHKDLSTITKIINENFNEGNDLRNTKSHHSQQKIETKAESKAKTQNVFHHHEPLMEDKDFIQDSSYYTLIKFAFFMDSFIFDAITESTEKKEEEVGLARFVLETMSLKGRMYSNNSIYTSMMLVSCILDDTRPGKEGRITRLMERTNDSSADSKPEQNRNKSMLEIIFQKKDEDSYIDIRVYKFTLILSMEFLQKLGDFFTADDSQPVEGLKQPNKVTDKVVVKKESSDVEYPTFTVNLRLEKPDIIFVENMDSTDVDALVFHTEMIMKYRVADRKQVISGTIGDIELYVCRFSSSKCRRIFNQIIKPFTISLAGSTPEGSGLHIDICVTEIYICINPNTIDLVTKCWEALMKDPAINQDDPSQEIHSDLWDVKQFSEKEYWFLKIEYGEDALAASTSISLGDRGENHFDEVCLLAVPSITILIEGVSTTRSEPLILVEMGYHMRCYDWSRKMIISNTLSLGVRYFNALVCEWEPIIEPVEKYIEPNNKHFYTPWELNCSVIYGEEGELEELGPPRVQVTLSCKEILQMTFTKTSVEVLKNLLDKYTTAATKHIIKKLPYLPPYVIKNETELVAELLLEDSKLQVWKGLSEDYNFVRLDSNSEVELQSYHSNSSEHLSYFTRQETRLFLRFPQLGDVVFEIPLGLPIKRYYPFLSKTSNSAVWAFVSELSIADNSVTVVLRSIFTIINYFKEPIHVHVLSKDGRSVEYLGTVEGNSKFALPFQGVYDTEKKLFFSVNGYSLSVEPFDWEHLDNKSNISCLLHCISKVPESQDPFFIQAAGEKEEIYFSHTTQKKPTSVIFNLYLQPTVKVFNSLPYPLVICFQGRAEEEILQPGNSLMITSAEPGSSTLIFRIDDYLEKEWSCKVNIEKNPPEFLVWNFVSYNGLAPESLLLGVYIAHKRNTKVYTIYCPYLMINKTDYLLSYKFKESTTVFYHPGNLKLPIMFSPTKRFFSQKHATLQVNQSSWSEKFPVDVAGSGGTVTCKDTDSGHIYKISVTISLSYNKLTRIVIFTPFYLLINSLWYDIEYQESDRLGNPWMEIPSRSSVPFWPQTRSEQTIRVRPKGSDDETPDFAYHSTDVCLLRLSKKYGGIFASVRATQSRTTIKFSCYEAGQAAVLILNYSRVPCVVGEPNTDYRVILNPFEKVMHAWLRPTGERKILVGCVDEAMEEISLTEDMDGFLLFEVKKRIMYTTFLDGTQRVLIITEDAGLSRSICSAKMTHSGVEVICKLEGIGVSLVNDISRKEILYMSLVSSNILWERKKTGKKRFKRLREEESFYLENAYQNYLEDLEKNSEAKSVITLPNNHTVDFKGMEMLEPFTMALRRTFEPGFWLAYRQIGEQVMLHLKINKVQIDSQLLESVFPVLLSPVPPPKSVAVEYQGPKPFIELSIVKIANHRTGVEQYKYFKILVQEFHVKMDIIFIHQIFEFLEATEMTDEREKANFNRDIEFMMKPLEDLAEVASSSEQKNFYHLLHFPPLKIHFSFSMAENLQTSSTLPATLSVMLLSIGITLTDVHDVVFRLSYLERNSTFLTNRELLNEIISHYYGQIIRQAYVLLLGLDVIGNPYGLITGIGQGVEDFFYEPFQGMIRGPSEFGKGVALGCGSLVRNTLGSAAGTLGKLTGTLGKGLAALSMDKEYQMQRMVDREQNTSIHASMARGGKGLFMGVVQGVAGVVEKPIKGAKEEGFGGFFKGIGKGMLGLVTRPATGVLDFASTSFNVVKRATAHGSETRRLRPPRFFRNEILVEPYNLREAEGNYIFYFVCKQKYCKTDKYCFHLFLKENEVVLLTNKRIILAEFNEVFGSWQEHMAITWKSMPERPRAHTKGVALAMPRRNAKAKPEVKVLLIESEEAKEDICKRMTELYHQETQVLDEFENPEASS